MADEMIVKILDWFDEMGRTFEAILTVGGPMVGAVLCGNKGAANPVFFYLSILFVLAIPFVTIRVTREQKEQRGPEIGESQEASS